MGTIVAVGGGSYDNGEIFPILKHIVSLSGKPEPNLLYLPTAGFDYIIGDEIIIDSFRQAGCKTSILFLTDPRLTPRDVEAKIMSADIIYAGGGNLKFLMNTLKATKADIYLKKAYEKGTVLSGYSSGAMCWFREGWDDCGENRSFIFVDGIGLLPYCNCPHFNNEKWNNFKNEIKTRSISGLAIESGCAVIFKDGEMYSISGKEDRKAYILNMEDNFSQNEIPEK